MAKRPNPCDERDVKSSSCGGSLGPPAPTTMSITSSLAVTVLASADAYGDATHANVDVKLDVVDRGMVCFAYGSVDALAATTVTTDGTTGYAATNVVLDVHGAEAQSQSHAVEGDNVYQYCGTSFLAVDLTALNATALTVDHGDATASGANNINGNTALFSAELTASGENSFVDLQADALAVEGQLSTVTVAATAAVSETTEYQLVTGTGRDDMLRATPESTIVYAGRGDDLVCGDDGDDWIFGEQGDDVIMAGAGDDGVFGGASDDVIWAESGDDWIFGGRGDDLIFGGGGKDLIHGGKGDDYLLGNDGDDLMSGGLGDDWLLGGAGNDVFRLGFSHGDGDDQFCGGAGADIWWVVSRFEKDVVTDFRLDEGDCIMLPDGEGMSLSRGSDKDDLVIGVRFENSTSTLVLDEFFVLNTGFDDAVPRRGPAGDAQSEDLRALLFDTDRVSALDMAWLSIGDMLSELG